METQPTAEATAPSIDVLSPQSRIRFLGQPFSTITIATKRFHRQRPSKNSPTPIRLMRGILEGVEDADDHPERPLRTHEDHGKTEDIPPKPD